MNRTQLRAIRIQIERQHESLDHYKVLAEADVSDEAHETARAMIGTLEERIADLKKGIEPGDHSNYKDALDRYGEELRHALDLFNDPFKAPELHVYNISERLMPAQWELQVAFAAMMREPREDS